MRRLIYVGTRPYYFSQVTVMKNHADLMEKGYSDIEALDIMMKSPDYQYRFYDTVTSEEVLYLIMSPEFVPMDELEELLITKIKDAAKAN